MSRDIYVKELSKHQDKLTRELEEHVEDWLRAKIPTRYHQCEVSATLANTTKRRSPNNPCGPQQQWPT